MSNEITERTIKSHYVIKVQYGCLDFIAQKRELCVSALCCFQDWTTTNLLTNTLRLFVRESID